MPDRETFPTAIRQQEGKLEIVVTHHENGIPREELDGIAIEIGQIRLLLLTQGGNLVDDNAPGFQQLDDGVNLRDLGQIECSYARVGKIGITGNLFQGFSRIQRQP